jgi:hypothetical protein
MKLQIFVAGIRFVRTLPENIHVKLDSSTPCWNDAIEGFGLN